MTRTREAELTSEALVRYLLEEEEIMKVLTDRVKCAMRAYSCEHCGAAVGQPCRTSNGATTFEHGNRYRQACDAGELPIDITEYYA